MPGRCAEALEWVGAATSFDRTSPRTVITLADSVAEPEARYGEQATSMPDRDLDRILQLLLFTGHVGAHRDTAGGRCRWRYLRLRPLGLTAVGAWPARDERAPLPTGCTVWDGRDAPVLGHLAAHGPVAVVACAPTDATRGARLDVFPGLPVTRVDGWWSLLALRDAGLVSGTDLGADGWRAVAATAAGRAVARDLAARPAPIRPDARVPLPASPPPG